MKSLRLLKVLKFVVIGIAAVGVMTAVVMWLWNSLMPEVFALKPITFAQAFGLLVLSKLLFGGFRGRSGPGMHWRRRMMERWEHMTPEEREKFREGMKFRCRGTDSPGTEVRA
jgi:hypothetical protein